LWACIMNLGGGRSVDSTDDQRGLVGQLIGSMSDFISPDTTVTASNGRQMTLSQLIPHEIATISAGSGSPSTLRIAAQNNHGLSSHRASRVDRSAV